MWGMLATALPATTVATLRCQRTLEPLQPRDDGLWSPAADLLYPVRDDLVYMGYDAPEADWIEQTMEEERVWQGTPENIDQDIEFLRISAPGLVDVINLIGQLGAATPGDRLIDVGSGSGWGSWLFAEAGYDPWMVDFEPNSLWLGGRYEHPRMGPGKRIVGDATLLPFADTTFGIALVKEFAHHVADKDRLFAEVNRVLRPGGLVVLIEPTHSLWMSVQRLRGEDPDEGHSQHELTWRETYVRALARNGMGTFWQGQLFHGGPGRMPLTRTIKRRSREDLRAGRRRRSALAWAHEHVIGGGSSMVALARKDRHVHRRPIPEIRIARPRAPAVGAGRPRGVLATARHPGRGGDGPPAHAIGGMLLPWTGTTTITTTPSCPRRRSACARWRASSSRRATSIPPRSTSSSRRTRRGSARTTGRGSSPSRGPIPTTAAGSSRTAAAAIGSLGYTGRQGENLLAVENTPRGPQHGRLHAVLLLPVAGARACRRSGTRRRRTARAPSTDPRGVLRRLRRRAARGHRDPSVGLDRRGCATSSCRCARRAPTAGARTSSPSWSRATR